MRKRDRAEKGAKTVSDLNCLFCTIDVGYSFGQTIDVIHVGKT